MSFSLVFRSQPVQQCAAGGSTLQLITTTELVEQFMLVQFKFKFAMPFIACKLISQLYFIKLSKYLLYDRKTFKVFRSSFKSYSLWVTLSCTIYTICGDILSCAIYTICGDTLSCTICGQASAVNCMKSICSLNQVNFTWEETMKFNS